MELKKRLELIDKLKTDKYIIVLLTGIQSINRLDGLSMDLWNKHKSKNDTISRKILQYRNDLIDEFEIITNDFYESAVKEITEFFGSSYDDDVITSYIFDFGNGKYQIDDLISKLKNWYIECEKIPEGHIGLFTPEGKAIYIPEEID
ncbi:MULTISPECIES: hypothetical protein [Bacillus]|uniref:Uncharacterized protein n=1 Tax=Bacillus thuringiensis serovar toumanoffi TaxID=180862 RepID=A0ABD5HZ08_BACTU|nr:hypothetical protein [Bacillus thuringiensis]EKS7844814.1 hypothetical protein [Bacillus cereus]EEM96491.1 hypothetical protein bthur0013_20930 [Bacillus thuringiensis IBL 200]MCR6780171.1 hypothetical protein [Bacillus thuringiensis]MCR6858240.1 hypothetical protein [Bacillus thuringiensis]MCR6866541.1 hypothetical protein [Bacillus thuringiensis]